MTPEEIGFPHCRHSVRVPSQLCGKRALRSGDEHLGHAEATLKTVCPHWGHLISVTARVGSGDWLSGLGLVHFRTALEWRQRPHAAQYRPAYTDYL